MVHCDGRSFRIYSICIAWLLLYSIVVLVLQHISVSLIYRCWEGFDINLSSWRLPLFNYLNENFTKIIFAADNLLPKRCLILYLPHFPCAFSGDLCWEHSCFTGSWTRGPWLAGHRKSSWRLLATSQCWVCRRWGCRQLHIPHPGNVSSQSPA